MTMTAVNLRADCISVLHDCDSALQAQIKVNALQKQIISDQEARYNAQHQELESAGIWKPIAEGSIAVILLETLILVLKK